jgi:tetratricopeptide (TPR) repeat protein
LRKAIFRRQYPNFILTTPGRGYQFIATVVEAEDDEKLDLDRYERFGRSGGVNTSAYKAYIQGRSFWNKRTGESLKQSVEHFEEALKHDPNFVLAYAGLAESHQLLAEYYAAAIPDKSLQKSQDSRGVMKAELAEAHTTLAYAQAFYDWDWAGADRSFKQALDLNPNSATAHQWYADYLCVLGRFDEARVHFDRAIRLNPSSPAIATGLASYYYTRGDAERLVSQSKKIIELDPGFGYGYFYLGFGYEFKGMEQQAVDAFAVAADLFGEPPEIGREIKAAYEQNGMAGMWHRRLEQYETRPHLKNYPPYLKSLVPIRLGDKEATLDLLELAYNQRDRGIVYAKHEPLLKPLRNHPRYVDLVNRLGLM